MKNILNVFKKAKKAVKKDTREWYVADMITPSGFEYKTGVRANNEFEARGYILHDAYEGNKIVNIRKGQVWE